MCGLIDLSYHFPYSWSCPMFCPSISWTLYHLLNKKMFINRTNILTFFLFVFIHPTRSHNFVNGRSSTNFKPSCSYFFKTHTHTYTHAPFLWVDLPPPPGSRAPCWGRLSGCSWERWTFSHPTSSTLQAFQHRQRQNQLPPQRPGAGAPVPPTA